MLKRVDARTLLLLLAGALACAATPVARPPEVRVGAGGQLLGRHAVVAADNVDAARIGAEILAAGGNVVDAAVATAFALGVAQPESSGIGGGGFLVYFRSGASRADVVDFREVAPARAHRDMYMRNGKAVAGASVDGPLAVGVPGEVAGLVRAHARFGKLPWDSVVLPAAQLASRGFRVSASLAAALARFADREFQSKWPAFRREFFRADGSAYRAGDFMRRVDLGRTLERIAKGGRDAFYRGETARDITGAAGVTSGGILTDADLIAYEPKEREAIRGSYRGRTVFTMPPPSSGGVVLLEALALLEVFDLPALFRANAYHHVVTQALIFGFADRANLLGDADSSDVPWRRLLTAGHRDKLRAAFDPTRATPHPDWPRPTIKPRDDSGTSHLSVMDAEGNAVALTTTINTTFGSKVVVPGTGILLNNQMDDFSIQPGVPNAYGLVGGEANAVKAGRRPLSSMSPTIVVENGRAVMALGGAGGPRIISATLQTLLNAIDLRWPVARAVAAPRLHHQWVPDRVGFEAGVGDDVVRALTSRGHRAEREDFFGIVQIAARRADGRLEAVSDPRKGGEPAGF
ncbi:MAG: gamma-glutamyltransferase [Deltaproteobacteria bacterium]|nr:gamma-glutamyltransferase [Deltaproteobacteria bacterium]